PRVCPQESCPHVPRPTHISLTDCGVYGLTSAARWGEGVSQTDLNRAIAAAAPAQLRIRSEKGGRLNVPRSFSRDPGELDANACRIGVGAPAAGDESQHL